METRPSEALDDIRKKRLAYFDISVKQSSSENIFVNGTKEGSSLLHHKEPEVKHAGKPRSDNSNEVYKREDGHREHVHIKAVQEGIESKIAKEIFTPDTGLNKKKVDRVENKKYNTDREDNSLTNSHSKRTATTKTDHIEDKVKSNLKTTSFFFSAEETGNVDYDSGKYSSTSLSNTDTLGIQASGITEKEGKNAGTDSKHVHYEDGYNETVERLIRATKEELLGKHVKDDIWSNFVQQQEGAVLKENLGFRRDSEPVLQESPVFSNFEPRRHSALENDVTNQASGTSDMVRPHLLQDSLQTNTSLTESGKQHHTKVNKSEDFADLGLSTHRPGSGKVTEELTIETHGVKLNESLTRQLRHALGAEKFREFLEKSKKDIDVLQQERDSARSEKGKRHNDKSSKTGQEKVNELKKIGNSEAVIQGEKKEFASHIAEDFTPRNDGDAVHDMIGEHVLKKKEPRQKLTTNPAYKNKNAHSTEASNSSYKNATKKVPELNLNDINGSPRPLLNRPKHEPYNIYQEKQNKHDDKKAELKGEVIKEEAINSSGKNYEQITVSRNVMFSADEIYFQAYGKAPAVPESPHGVQMRQQGTHVIMGNQGDSPMPKGILVNNHGVPVTPHEIPLTPHGIPVTPHAVPLTSHGIPATPHTPVTPHNGITISHNVPMSPHYPSNFNPAEVIPASVASSVSHQKYFNMPLPPPLINGPFNTPPDNRSLAGFVPTVSAQTSVNSVNVQLPHPPSQPPPAYSHSHQISAHGITVDTAASPQYVATGFPPEPQWIAPTAIDQKNYPVHQGAPGYPMTYSYPYPVVMMAPHPPAEPVTPSEVAETAEVQEKSTVTDKVEEETTFTSVSQIQHKQEEIKVPHPPETKKDGKKRSPRKLAIPDRAAKRHVDGIRQHHEQRRQEQDEKISEAQIVEKQRKFAKASIERYFQSLESLYKPSPKLNLDGISDVLSESSDENEQPESNNKLKEIPEVDLNQNKVTDNEKFNEIFKRTDPSNFCIKELPSEIDFKSKVLDEVDNDSAIEEKKRDVEKEDNVKSINLNSTDPSNFDIKELPSEIDLKCNVLAEVDNGSAIKEKKRDVEKEDYLKSINSNSKHDVVVAAVNGHVKEPEIEKKEVELDCETLINTAVTGFSVNAGGLTERLNELGIDPKHVKGEANSNIISQQNVSKAEGQKVKKGKLLIICPECEGFNKDYMSWCTHCGEMIIGIEPVLVSKNRQGKIRTKPVTEKEFNIGKSSLDVSENVEKLNQINETQPKAQIDNILNEKPLQLDLGLMKSDSPNDTGETKLSVSPNKSDGKDSGRPSSDDQDLLLNRNRIEQEVEDDICETITDPVVKGYVKSHFAKRRQMALENKSLPSSENMKSKVQSWIEEIGGSEVEPVIAQTSNSHNAQEMYYSNDKDKTMSNGLNDSLAEPAQKTLVGSKSQHIPVHYNTAHLEASNANVLRVKALKEVDESHMHFEKPSSPKLEEVDLLLEPPEIPKFGADLPFDPTELTLKLTTDSMDFSQLGSVDFSHLESVNIDEKKNNEQVKNDKAVARQERRRKRGHGAIDVEVFGYEESRECKNSSRGQRLVPVLNLPLGSSDEDASDQEDETDQKYETENDVLHDLLTEPAEKTTEDATVYETGAVKQSLTAWQSMDSVEKCEQEHVLYEVNEKGAAGPASIPLRPEESTDDWKLLFDPLLAEDEQEETSRQEEETEREEQQPFLMQLIEKQGAKSKRPKSSKGKPAKSKVRQSVEKTGYQRKWARSSTAWSSYNPGELNTSSSLRLSIDAQSSDRGQGQGLCVTNGNLSERSSTPVRAAASKGRPASADVYKRKQQKQRPVSASMKKSRDRSRGKKDKDDEILYELVEHRLPRKGIPELLQDRITSPRSTYDKYLQMTPRIHEGTLSCWQCLPDEILIHIFAYLSQSDLTQCAQVCHQFYRVAMDESLWKYITIKKKTDLDDSCLVEISKRHPVSLALIHCHGDDITAKGLRDMFRECADTLKELNISRCSRGALSGDSILLHAAARCHNITHIDTSWCNVTDSGLMAISTSCNRLESLCINGCQAMSNDGLETIIKKHGASLRVLEMFGCFNITPRGLQAVSNNCINLTSLHLGQCYKLTDSSIAQLSSSLGRVETLDLRGCKQLKDNCIRRVVKNCTRLKHLSLANCPNITDVSILEISTYLTDIRSIDLCGCKNITDSSIRALVNTCTNLRHIDISSTGCTHRSVSMIANFCAQRLETLRINFLSDVTEASLIKLAKHCRRLTSVHLYGCPSVKNLDKIKEENPTFSIEM